MGDEANSERHRRERAVRLIEHGTDLTGPLAGAGVGMLGGPLGALAGAAVGAAVQKVLIRVGDEFAQRQLGPREQTRAGAALYFALTDIEERLKAGEPLREDGFFDEDDVAGRSRADELLEATLARALHDHEERKVRHLGWLYASVAFDSHISAEHVNFLIDLAARLTYQELVFIALVHDSPYRSLPSWSALHPFDPGAHAVAAQFYDLARRGVLFRTDSHPVREYSDADPSPLRVGMSGHLLHQLMRLDRIERSDVEAARKQLKTVSDQPTPWQLLGHLELGVDSLRLTETDLDGGHARFALDDKAREVLPGTGSEPWVLVRGEHLKCRYSTSTEEEVGTLVYEGDERRKLAGLVEPGQILRLSRGHDDTLWLD